MEPLYHPVGLGMVGGGKVLLDSKLAAQGGPRVGAELYPTVGGDNRWESEKCDPRAKKSFPDHLGRDFGQRDGLREPRVPIDDGEHVPVPTALLQRSHQI